jgi:hypothetical protein
MPLRRALACLLSALCVLAACSGDDDGDSDGDDAVPIEETGDDTVLLIREATEAAGPVAVTGTVTQNDVSEPFEGSYAADPLVAQVTVPIFLPDEVVDVEFRMVDGALYINRIEATPELLATPAIGALERAALRRTQDVVWLERPVEVARLTASPAVYGPFLLLDFVDSADFELESLGVEDVDGTALTHYSVVGDDRFRILSLESIDIWSDEDDRLRRVRAVTTTATTEYSIDEFGVTVDPEVPPAGDTTTEGVPGTTATPAGELIEAGSGTAGAYSWTLSSAPSSNGGLCWQVEVTPAVTGVVAAPVCFDTSTAGVTPALTVEFPTATDGTAEASVIVAVTPVGVTEASFGFADGSSAPAVFVAPEGAAVWVGPASPAPGALALTFADGTAANCGPGAVSTVGDLVGLDEETLAETLTFPWACVDAG